MTHAEPNPSARGLWLKRGIGWNERRSLTPVGVEEEGGQDSPLGQGRGCSFSVSVMNRDLGSRERLTRLVTAAALSWGHGLEEGCYRRRQHRQLAARVDVDAGEDHLRDEMTESQATSIWTHGQRDDGGHVYLAACRESKALQCLGQSLPRHPNATRAVVAFDMLNVSSVL